MIEKRSNADGIHEVFFALTDGTAYLRALMHDDGNIRYANYQSEQEVIDYFTANGYDESTYGDWFTGAPQAGPESAPQAEPSPSSYAPILPTMVSFDGITTGQVGQTEPIEHQFFG